MKLTPVAVICGKLEIAQDENYKLHLARDLDTNTPEILNLYAVWFKLAGGEETRKYYVLAEDEAGASHQVHCHKSLCNVETVETSVTRLPLMLRGWSGNEF